MHKTCIFTTQTHIFTHFVFLNYAPPPPGAKPVKYSQVDSGAKSECPTHCIGSVSSSEYDCFEYHTTNQLKLIKLEGYSLNTSKCVKHSAAQQIETHDASD